MDKPDASTAAPATAPVAAGALTNPIRGQATLRADDFTAAWLALPQTRLTLTWFVLAPIVPVVTLLVSGVAIEATTVGVIAFGVLTCGYFVLRGRTRFAEAGLGGQQTKTVEYAFDDYGYYIKAPNWESHLAWSSLHQQLQTSRAFMIFTTPRILTIVPKRAFSAADRALLGRQLGSRVAERPAGPASVVTKWVILFVAFIAIWHFQSR